MTTYRRFPIDLVTSVVLACAAAVASPSLGQVELRDPAGGPPTTRTTPAPTAAEGLNDMLLPATPIRAGAPSAAIGQPDQSREATPSGLSLVDRLRTWDDDTRQNAQIQVELPGRFGELLGPAARQIEAAWNAGEYGVAIVQLQALESSGAPVALGVNWRTPVPGGGLRGFTDVRIGTRTGGAATALDYDAATKKLFAVVRWDSDNGWGLYMSTTGGNSWAETYFWYAGAGQHAVAVDAVVVSDYVYVGYVASDVASEGRLRRNLVSTGGSDTTFGFQTVLDATPNTITEAKVASNADSFANRVYYAVRQSNNAVRYAWDVSTDGTTFEEVSLSGATAVGGLDLCWNPGYTTYYLFLSYIGTDGRVHVWRDRTAGWSEATTAPFDGTHNRTTISAFDDHTICAHELQMTNGQGIRYFISHDGGETWDYYNYVAEPAAGEGPYQMADVTARGGAGTAIVFSHETGEPDDVMIRYRRNYAPGLWHDAIRVNDNDVSTGTWNTLCWVPRDTENLAELDYGIIYFYGSTPYYSRFQNLPGDLNCDGVVNFDDINPFVVALSSPGNYAYLYPNCDVMTGDCNGDGVVNFSDINAFVALLAGGQ